MISVARWSMLMVVCSLGTMAIWMVWVGFALIYYWAFGEGMTRWLQGD